MDLSQILSMLNGSGQNNSLQSLLPLILSGQNGNQSELFSSLAKNNPNLSQIMQFLPNMQNNAPTTNKKQKKITEDYVKISDYYDEN